MKISHISLISKYNATPTTKPVFRGEKGAAGGNITVSNPRKTRGDVFVKTNPMQLQRGQFLIDGEIFIAHSTEMFRSDLNWRKFGNYLKDKFGGQNKVNTYVYGCSDGSEAYTMSVLLQDIFKDEPKGGAKRFFPIIAKDISQERIRKNISEQRTGNVQRYKQAFIKTQVGLRKFSENELDKYMERIDAPIYASNDGAILKERVTRPVKFRHANILDDIENIDSKHPAIIMARNMWPYVEAKEYKEFAKELYNRLCPGSIVVIGAFDWAQFNSSDFPSALIKAGFKPAKTSVSVYQDNPLIFEKRGEISFKGNRGEISDSDGKVFRRSTTYMFRGDLDWKRFGNFLQGRFDECDKVNVYNYAASNGYEPYSLSILLQARFKDEAGKFFPIFAKDIDGELIEKNIVKQRSGNVETEQGYDRAQRVIRLSKDELLKYMKPDIYLYNATLHNEATRPVEFNCANILEDIENIDSNHPSLVMARNMWPYVDKGEYEDFAKRLYNKLAPGSVVVVGDFDYSTDDAFPPKLIEAGFKPLDNDIYNLIFLKD